MKYILIKDVDDAALKKGMIIDEDDDIYMTIKLDKKFYERNPHAFKPLEDNKI